MQAGLDTVLTINKNAVDRVQQSIIQEKKFLEKQSFGARMLLAGGALSAVAYFLYRTFGSGQTTSANQSLNDTQKLDLIIKQQESSGSIMSMIKATGATALVGFVLHKLVEKTNPVNTFNGIESFIEHKTNFKRWHELVASDIKKITSDEPYRTDALFVSYMGLMQQLSHVVGYMTYRIAYLKNREVADVADQLEGIVQHLYDITQKVAADITKNQVNSNSTLILSDLITSDQSAAFAQCIEKTTTEIADNIERFALIEAGDKQLLHVR